MALAVRMRLRIPPTPLFRQAPRPVMDAVFRPRLTRVMLRWERGAKGLTPVDTGLLRASLSGRVTGGFAGVRGGLRGILGSPVVYAPFVEFGTRHMRARRMVQDSLEQLRPTIRTAFEGGLRELAQRLGGR